MQPVFKTDSNLLSSWYYLTGECEPIDTIDYEDWYLIASPSDNKEDITQSSPATENWVIVNEDPSVITSPPSYQTTLGYKSNTLQQLLLDWLFLKEAIFGQKDSLSGKMNDSGPLGTLISSYLSTAKLYLRQTPHEKISIPYTDQQALNGMLFSAYNKEQEVLAFDCQLTTALLLSGSFAPQEAYMTGIIEGYRKKGVQVLAINYIGFGDNFNGGEPSAETTIACAEAAIHYLLEKGIPNNKIIIHGYSLGGFPATALAAEYNTHLVLDRVSTSTENIALTVLNRCLPDNFLTRILTHMTAKIAMFGAPFSIYDIQKIKGKVFVVQEFNPETQKIGALPFVRELQPKNALLTTEVTTHWINGIHFSSPCDTWTVHGQQFAKKLKIYNSQHSYTNNKEARQSWKHFIKSIKA